MQVHWNEFILKIIMLFISVFFTIYYQGSSTLPIAELAVAIIISAQFMLAKQLKQASIDEMGISSSLWQRLSKVDYRILVSFILLQIILACIFMPYFLLFIPVFYFELYLRRPIYLIFSVLVLPAGYLMGYPFTITIVIMGISILASYLHTSVQRSIVFEAEAYHQIDDLKAVNNRFRQEQQNLIAIQDQRSESQVLMERKRIVNEIHDILGHQLSSAVIQIGALEYIVEDEMAKESLGQVREVLNTSMNNIRTVIHEERASTIDLERELSAITSEFTKVPIQFAYQNSKNLSNQDAHSIINIVREGLANINKHSDATKVQVRFVETVDRWTLLIADNGRPKEHKDSSGIGLLNIEERVDLLGGNLLISKDNGFRIFITIPFKEVADESTIS